MNNELINLITIYFITGIGILFVVLIRTYVNDDFFVTSMKTKLYKILIVIIGVYHIL